jgi:sugar phosphate permease
VEIERSSYRWVVLAVGTAAQASVSAVFLGVAVLAPQLRARYGLTLDQVGVLLAATSVGMTPTLLPWGVLADRVGERIVLPVGLAASAVVLAPAGFASSYVQLALLLVAAGAFAASVNAASGRAVMHWFPHSERGLALGIRQANVPIGGLLAALTLPALASWRGLGAAFVALAAASGAGAFAGLVFLRERSPAVGSQRSRLHPLGDRAVWRLSWGSGLLMVGQIATMGFTVLFLHAARGFSPGAAAAVLAAQQVLGAVLRVVAGLWSDRLGVRVAPMRRLALAIALTLLLVALLDTAGGWLLVPALVVAGGVGLSWNGLSFTAAAEIAGPGASGAAIGVQQTVLGIGGILIPLGFSAGVSHSSWRTAFIVAAVFPLLGWAVLRPLAARRGSGATAA